MRIVRLIVLLVTLGLISPMGTALVSVSSGGNTAPSAPGTPSDSGSVTNATSVTWSWSAATDSDGSVSDYQIDIGTSAGGSQVASATSTSGSTSYTKTGLSNGTTYYARVRAVDNLGATGSYSGDADGIAVDTAGPSMSSLAAGSLSTSGATITWTSSESATGQVKYGTTSGSYPSSSSVDSSRSTSHSISLSGLGAGTTYYFQVVGTDEAGNDGSSSQSSFVTTAETSSPTTSSTPSSDSGPSSTNSTTTTTTPSTTSSSESGSSSNSSTSTETAPTASSAATTTKKTETKTGALNTFGAVHSSFTPEIITNSKALTSLTSFKFLLSVEPAKPIKKATVAWQGATTDLVKSGDGKRHQVELTSQAAPGTDTATIAITYTDGKKEEVAVAVTAVPKGKVLDSTGEPIANATVTLEVQKDGQWVTWDPGQSGQLASLTTAVDGLYGFVVSSGTYRVSATHPTLGSTEPTEIAVGAPGGVIAKDLTLVAAAQVAATSTAQPTNDDTSWPWWLWLLIVIILVSLLFFLWWKRKNNRGSSLDTDQRV